MYVMPRTVAIATLAFAAAAFAPGAFAHNSYVADIPNGMIESCTTCHGAEGNYAEFNSFGDDFRTAMNSSPTASPATSWAMLFDTDSDGDGQTNGEELGDPCGVFTSSSTPARGEAISHPGDNQSSSATPHAPDDDEDTISNWCDNCRGTVNTDQADTDGDGIGDACAAGETPSCAASHASSASPLAGALASLALLGLLAVRRRR